MDRKRLTRLLAPCALLLLLTACNRSSSSPLAPGPSGDGPSAPSGSLSDPLPALPEGAVGLQGSLAVLGGTIDFDTTNVSIDQPRFAAATGDTFDVDATDFFLRNPCTDCAMVESIGWEPGGLLRVDLRLQHPFDPATGRTDLLAFDPRGILIVPGNESFPSTTADLDGDGTTGASEVVSGNLDLVTNADGYTTRYDARAEDPLLWGAPKNIAGTLNPFKRYFVSASAGPFDPANPVGHNVMPLGAAETQSWLLKPPMGGGQLPFVFVVDVAWGVAKDPANPGALLYRLPEFQRKEAWEVGVSVTSSDLAGGDAGSSASLEVTVKDWQHGAAVAAVWPSTNPDEVRASSDVAQVMVDVPGVNNLDTVTSPSSGTGSNTFPLKFNVTVFNDLEAGTGTYTGMVTVRDALATNPEADPLPMPDGVSRGTPIDIRDYSTYVPVTLTVGSGSSANLDDPLPYSLIYATSAPVDWSGAIAGVVSSLGWTPDGNANVGNLWRLDPDGTTTNLTNFFRGNVRKPTLNYTGTRVAFAAKIGSGGANWQIYTMDPDGTNLTNLSRNAYNDIDPEFLPDGRLVFASDRAGWSDPYHLSAAPQLYLMDAAGNNATRLTYSASGDYWPVMLNDGRISFRRWDNFRIHDELEWAELHSFPMGFPEDFWMGDINGCSLWVINPDGTVPDLFYGSHLGRDHRFFGDHSQLPDGKLLAVWGPMSSTWGAGALAVLDPDEYDNIETPLCITPPEAAQRSPSAYGRYRFPSRLDDGRYAATYAPGAVFDQDPHPTPDFGLALVDPEGNRRMLVDEPGVWEWMPLELKARPTPATLPVTDSSANWGILASANVFLRDAREPESKDPQPIPFPGPGFKVRFFAVVPSDTEVLQDPINPDIVVARPHQLLGEAPVAADGSFAVMVPAHVPLNWQLIGPDGKTVVVERFYTHVEGGETRFCQGCHAPQRPGAFPEVALEDIDAIANPTDLRP